MDRLFVTATRLQVPHGFSTRTGGVSCGVYASLNLGWTVGDEPSRVETNFERLAFAADFELARLHTVSQVHGEIVHEVAGRPPKRAHPGGEADGLWTGEQGTVVGVKTADCVPILLVAPDIGAVAAVHSGWRGTLLGVAARAVAALQAQGARPSEMRAALGPAIQRCCYEVSPELGDRFRVRFGPQAVDRSERGGQGPHLDLTLSVAQTLEEAGVPRAQVERLDACTSCEEAQFFSHRRDAVRHGGAKGLHLSFAECRFA